MGRYRDLTDAEIKELNELIEPSVKRKKRVYQEPETPKEERNSSKDDPGFKKRRLLNFKTLLSLFQKIIINLLIIEYSDLFYIFNIILSLNFIKLPIWIFSISKH
jgi:hypothetical protein